MTDRQTISPAEFKARQAREMSESELHAAITDALSKLGWLWFHVDDGLYRVAAQQRRWDVMGNKGFLDIIALKAGRCLVIETKAEGGKFDTEQERWLSEWRAVQRSAAWPRWWQPQHWPVQVYVWRPSDWLSGDVERILRGDDAP